MGNKGELPRETMETETKIEIISRKTIKPSSPTPHHNRILKLSLLDQFLPPTYGCFIFFYNSTPNNGDDYHHSSFLEKSNSLQKSLSETLVHFYPFAGRLKDSSTIECNDEGAYFVEAQMNCKLSEILNEAEAKLLNQFLNPINNPKIAQLATNAMLVVQVTAFKCGGIAIAICNLHKLVDASSACAFAQNWTGQTRGDDPAVIAPNFIGTSLIPPIEPKDLQAFPNSDTLVGPQNFTITTRRLVFNASNLASLKAKIVAEQVLINPTNVQLVTAMVLSGLSKPSLLSQSVNLRKIMILPLPENAVGNLISAFRVLVEENDGLHEIVGKMRKECDVFCKEMANRYKGEEGFLVVLGAVKEMSEVGKKGINMYNCTSLCKFPVYDSDFGWGKPIWVISPMFFKNVFALVDTKYGDGIEVWVTLEE
ncbi:hypothetical protein UlMin_006396 [Ulmus minor]